MRSNNQHTPPLFDRFMQATTIIFVFGAIGLVGTDDYQHAQAAPIDWADDQRKTLLNLYSHYTPEKARQLAEFYGVHRARQDCINSEQNKNQTQFNQCVSSQKQSGQTTQKQQQALDKLIAKLDEAEQEQ